MDAQVVGRELSRTDWIDADGKTLVAKAFELADASAGRATDWYSKAMRRRGRAARAIRLVALIFFGIGGLVPIAKAFLERLPGGYPWADVGYIALAIGGGLLGFDYFFGISSAYTRFVTTEIALQNARDQFHTDWLVLVARRANGTADMQLQPLIERLQAFVTAVVQLVERETQEWVVEFRSSLTELEKLGERVPHGAPPPREKRDGEVPSPQRNGGVQTVAPEITGVAAVEHEDKLMDQPSRTADLAEPETQQVVG